MRVPFWVRTLALIKAHKISQEKFAAYTGIHFRTFKGWVHFNRIPDAITCCDIADALGVTVEYLARGEDGLGAELRLKQTEQRKTISAMLQKQAARLVETAEKLR